MSLSHFHPVTQRWFTETLGIPTAAQAGGWESIRERKNTLIAAPTGSGKTLAAFLTALDELFVEGLEAPLPDEVRVVYVSPLKALSADIQWMREAFASATNARAIVIAFHGSPSFEEPPGHEYRKQFEPFLGALEDEAARFKKPVLLIHGDDHEYLVDSPVISRRRLPNLTRLEVPGSPDVGWVRVTVTPASPSPFAFERRVVGGWKYW